MVRVISLSFASLGVNGAGVGVTGGGVTLGDRGRGAALYIDGEIKVPCIVQELCESRGGRPGLSVLTSLLVSVDVKNY